MEQTIDKWAERLASVMAEYGSDAADLAMSLGQLGAARELLWGFCGVALGLLVAWKVTLPSFRTAARAIADAEEDLMDEKPAAVVGCGLLGMVSGLVAFVFVVEGLNDLISPFAWAGLWHPEVYLAAKALGWV